MSQNKKIVLIVVLALVISCCLLCVLTAVLVPNLLSKTFSTDPAKAKATGAQIVDYTMPPGYQEMMGMDMFFEQIVLLGREDKRGVTIMLFQIKATNVSRDQMEQQMRQAFQGQFSSGSSKMTPVGTRTVKIKNQSVTLNISESTGSTPLRQAIGVFPGKGGLAMVMLTGTVREWDWDMLDAFFQSMR